jgi:hypothetical protein
VKPTKGPRSIFLHDGNARGTLQLTHTMQGFLRDFLLSVCPAKVRQRWRPGSQLTVLRSAMWGGAAQFLLMALVLIGQFKHYFLARSQQMTPHMGGDNSTGEAVVTVLIVLEFLFHPLSLCLFYFAFEGAVRFIGSLVTAEVVPSLFVFLFFKLSEAMSHSLQGKLSGPSVADAVQKLADGRIRIATASLKAGWNASITIGIGGQWFEVERKEQAPPPYRCAYVLRPAPLGKVLRGYQEYPDDAVENATTGMQDKNLP